LTLEGEIIRLEALSLNHQHDLCEVGLEPSIWEWNTRLMKAPEHMKAYIEEAIEERDRGVSIPFAIVLKETGKAIGSTRYGAISRANRRLEIGWTWIGVDFQRTGVNTECKLLLLTHAFEEMSCLRVELKTDVMNSVSRRAILRLGAKEEGILRSHMIGFDGRVRDTVYYSILASEWPTVRDRLVRKMEAHG
jgi:RimJ/RimL family protein N-acetyltransferase